MKQIVAKSALFALVFACAGLELAHAGWTSSAACPQDDIKPDGEYHDHYREFLDLVEKGTFDGKTIYTDTNSSIGKGLLNTPLSHWKSFTQKSVLKDENIKRIPDEVGKPLRILEIETKTGHKLTVHLVDLGMIKNTKAHSYPSLRPL